MKLKMRVVGMLTAALLLFAAVAGFSSCGKKAKYTVGICQLVTHDALDAATEGFKAALVELLGTENVEFDYQNAANSSETCGTIINTFVSKRVDLILANATPSLLAAINSTRDIPILGTAITDYGKTLDISDFNGVVGGNVSGTSDKVLASSQAEMLRELCPDAKTVGVLYCTAEPNSIYQVEEMKVELEKLGLTVKDCRFSTTTELTAVVEKAAQDCDVIYAPTDNTLASSATTVYDAMGNNKKPLIAGEKGLCAGCGVATLSIDYYKLGYETGKMAAEILQGKANISEMAIRYDTEPQKLYNERICREIGFRIPEGYRKME